MEFSRNNYIIQSLFQENEKKLVISRIHMIKLHLDHQWSSHWPYNRYFTPVKYTSDLYIVSGAVVTIHSTPNTLLLFRHNVLNDVMK